MTQSDFFSARVSDEALWLLNIPVQITMSSISLMFVLQLIILLLTLMFEVFRITCGQDFDVNAKNIRNGRVKAFPGSDLLFALLQNCNRDFLRGFF